jgi:hypothetical protein
LGALFVVLVLVAVVAWGVAIAAAVRITTLAPAGQRLETWFSLGWWRFARVRELAGDAAIPYIKRFVQAFLAFFAVVLAAIVLTFLVAMSSPSGPPVEAAERLPLPITTPHSSSLES